MVAQKWKKKKKKKKQKKKKKKKRIASRNFLHFCMFITLKPN